MPALCREHTDAVTSIAVSPEGSPLCKRQLGHQPPHLAHRSATDSLVHCNCDLQPARAWLLISAKPARYACGSPWESYSHLHLLQGQQWLKERERRMQPRPSTRQARRGRRAQQGAAMPSAPSVEASSRSSAATPQAVSSVAWPSPETILSGSWDNSVSAPLLCQPSAGPCTPFLKRS